MALAHTPYDGSRKPFTIGMSLLDPERWIEIDGHLGRYLDKKDALFAQDREAVFREEPDTRDAQAEVLAMLADHLVARFPETYRRSGSRIEIMPIERFVDLDDGEAPLLAASRLVQEDLCLMREGPGGYRLAAACLCFPSSWSLREKFGRTLDGLHDNVPGYAGGFGPRTNRIFASLKADLPVERMNWSIYADHDLHHPAPRPKPRNWLQGEDDIAAFVRVERQTLRRLPLSGDILFTIRIHVDPLEAFRGHPERRRLAAGLRDDLMRLDGAQLAYKGLSGARERLASALDRLADG